jgi:hypothetical protein
MKKTIKFPLIKVSSLNPTIPSAGQGGSLRIG